jgi:hypothetical protein
VPTRPYQQVATAALSAVTHSRIRIASALDTLGQPPAGERRWVRLAHTRTFDAWLIAWGCDSEISAHDHGDSAGALTVLDGSLVELTRDRTRNWVARELTPGTTIEVPSRRVHQVANAGVDVAVSVHAYSPSLRALTFHEDFSTAGAGAQ